MLRLVAREVPAQPADPIDARLALALALALQGDREITTSRNG